MIEMTCLVNALLAAPPVLVLAMLLYAAIDRETVEREIEKKMQRWDGR